MSKSLIRGSSDSNFHRGRAEELIAEWQWKKKAQFGGHSTLVCDSFFKIFLDTVNVYPKIQNALLSLYNTTYCSLA